MRIFLQLLFLLSLPLAALAQEEESTTTTTTTTESEDTDRTSGGFAIEPMLLYNNDDAKIRTSQVSGGVDDTTATSRGAGLGLRLGGHVEEILILGADARFLRTRIDDSSYGKADANDFTLGPTLGLQMPVAGLRIWGTYVLVGDYDPEAGANGFDVRFQQPRGPRVGAGIHVGPVSVNVEYHDLTYNKTKIESLGLVDASATTDVDYDTRGYTASLSFPMEM